MFSEFRHVIKKTFQYHKPKSKCMLGLNHNVHFSQQQTLFSKCMENFVKNLNTNFSAFAEHVAEQVKVITSQRLRRTFLIISSYRRIHGDQSLKNVFYRLGSSLLKHCERKKLFFICSATLFKWENARISDEELNSLVEDMIEIQHIEEDFKSPVDLKGYLKSWEPVIDKSHLKVWRRPIPKSHLYEYKVYGTFNDVTPKCFLDIQVDLEYRKEWDNRVIKLDVIDKDDESNTEVVQWITHYPYPMYSREYVYSRRFQIDEKNNVMVLSAHAVDHPKCPVEKDHVRVHVYNSTMVIKPHKTFDDDGLDYVMTYSDDPQANYPTFCYSWLASKGVSDFVDELHYAAKRLEDKRQQEAAKSCVNKKDPSSQGNQDINVKSTTYNDDSKERQDEHTEKDAPKNENNKMKTNTENDTSGQIKKTDKYISIENPRVAHG